MTAEINVFKQSDSCRPSLSIIQCPTFGLCLPQAEGRVHAGELFASSLPRLNRELGGSARGPLRRVIGGRQLAVDRRQWRLAGSDRPAGGCFMARDAYV